jgi:hypothetical protein
VVLLARAAAAGLLLLAEFSFERPRDYGVVLVARRQCSCLNGRLGVTSAFGKATFYRTRNASLLRMDFCLRLLSDDGGQDEKENTGGVGDPVARDDARPCTLVVPR